MSFRDKYTTDFIVAADSTPGRDEKKKIVLSSDAFALAELLECLINKMTR